MKTLMALVVVLMMSTTSQASVPRILDGTAITVGSPSNLLTFPQTTDTVADLAGAQTFTNKSLSGSANTFTLIPAGTALSGQAPVANGGTGAASFTTNGMLFGNGTSAFGVTSAGSQYQTFQAGASGIPTVGAIQLNQSAAVANQLGVGNGGTGASTLTLNNVILGNGSSAVQFVAPGTSGNVLQSNGTTWTSGAIASAAPSLNGGSGAPQSVTASGGVSLASISYNNFVWVVGSPGAVTVTATPSITACTADGQLLHVIGTDVTKTVTLQDNAGLSGSNLQLNGTWVGALYSVLNLHCDATLGMWVEDSRR